MPAERKRRDEYTHYQNAEPVTDPNEILDLLAERRGDSSDGRFISTRKPTMELHQGWYIHGDSGGDRSGIYYYQIDAEAAKKLVAEGWVTPKRIPAFGYTETRQHELVLSQKGKAERQRFLEEQKKAAMALIEPGVHTKWSSVFNCRDHGRPYPGVGPLHFDFITPMDEKVRVYPSLKKVEKVE